jgi:uncharacterized protein (TIGR02996 family)
MKPEEVRFLERICAEADDDAPRLIFADWLDEQGDPRGEFIRLQVALARLHGEDPVRIELLDREAALLGRYYTHWSQEFRGIVGGPEYYRGFVETVFMEARTFLRRADDLFRLAPVRHIQFLDVGNSLGRLMQSSHLAKLSSLTIYAQHVGERLTRALVDSPHLGELRTLNIGRNNVGDRAAERLACSPRFRQLTTLDLSDNTISDSGARAIAASSNLGNLESLALRGNELTRAGLGSLCASNELIRLRHLGVSLNDFGASLEWTPPRAGKVELASLDVSENSLRAEELGEVTGLPGLAKLRRLTCSQNEIGNAGAATLAAWSGAASLEVLQLAGNRIGDEGARILARSPYLFRVVDLDLSDNPIHDPGAFQFLNTKSLPRLRRLGLPHLGLTPHTRRALAVRYSR